MMNPLSCDSAQHVGAAVAARPVDDAFALVHGAAVMPDVIAPAPAASHHPAASSQCHVCQVTCRHHTPSNNSSSSSSAAAAADYHVTHASREKARQSGVTEPLPDLVNVHRPAPTSSSPYEYDRPSTSASVVYYAANVNHYMPAQPPTSASGSHSPTHRCVRGTLSRCQLQ